MAMWDEDKAKLMSAGFSEADTQNIAYGLAQKMQASGSSPEEFENAFGKPPEPDADHLPEYFSQQLNRNISPEDKNLEQPDPNTVLNAIKAGYENSAMGLRIRGKLPDTSLEEPSIFDEGAPWALRKVQQVSNVVSSLPTFAAGAALGAPGGPVAAMAMAMGYDASARAALMKAYSKGGVKSWDDFKEVAGPAALEGLKGAAIGAGAAVGGVVGSGLAGVSTEMLSSGAALTTGQTLAPLAGELAGMTGTQAAVEQRIPTLEEITDNAMLLGGAHAIGAMGSKLSQIYTDTGAHPQEIATQAMNDPVLKQQILSKDTETPQALESIKQPMVSSDFVVKDNKLIPGDKPEAQAQFDFGKTTLDDIKADSEERLSMGKREEAARLHDPQAFRAMESMSRDVKQGESVLASNNETLDALKPSEKSLKQLEAVRDQLKSLPVESPYKYSPMDVSQPTEGKEFYHGTKANLSSLSEATAFPGHVKNLYGHGLYLTDNPEVAKSYAENKGKGATGSVLSGKLKDVNLLDLEKPLPDNARDIFNKAISDHSDQKLGKGISGVDAFSTLKEAMQDGGITESEASDVYDNLNQQLSNAGFQGYRHEGKGSYGGRELGKHNVAILFGDETGSVKNSITDTQSERQKLQEKEAQLSENEEQIRNDSLKAQQLRAENDDQNERLNRVALGAKLKPRLINAWEQGQKTLESNLKDRITNKTIQEPNDPLAKPIPGFNPDYTTADDTTPQLTKSGKEFHTQDEAMDDYYGNEDRNLSGDEIISHLLRNHPELAKRIAPEIVFEKSITDAEGNVGKSNISIGPKTPKAPDPLTMANIERDYFNNLQRVEAAEKETSKMIGRPLTMDESPSAKILNARAFQRQVADWLGKPGEREDSTYGVVNPDTGEVYSPSRAKIVDDSGLDYKNKEEMDTLRKYRMYREVIDENAAGRSTGVSDIEARSFIEDNKAKYEQAAAGLTNWHNSISQLLADKGIFSQESVDASKEAHPNYVPLSRLTPEMKSKSGFNPNMIMKSREGSELPFVDPSQSDFDKATNAARIITRNDAVKALVRLNDLRPEDNKLFNVDSGTQGQTDLDSVMQDDPTLSKPFKQEKNLDAGQIAYMDGGEVKTITFADEDLQKAMASVDFNPGVANAVRKFLGPIDTGLKLAAGAIRFGATSGWDFLFRHEIRDELNTSLTNKELRVPFLNTIRFLGDAIGKDSDLYVEANRNGALNGTMTDIDAMVGNKYYAMGDKNGAWSTAWNVIKSPWELNHGIMQIMQEAKRLSIYDVKVKALGENPTPADLQRAGNETMESSINGLRIGAKMQGAVSYMAFLHYDTQGTYQSAKILAQNPERAAVAGAMLTTAAVSLWFANHDDPDYQALSDHEKLTFLHIKIDGVYHRIPTPWTMGSIFCAIPAKLLDFAQNRNADTAMNIAKAVLNVSPLNPLELRQSVDKLSAAGMIDGFVNNYNSVTGKNIIPDSMLNGPHAIAPESQVKPYTSNTAIEIGKAFNYNGAIATLAHQVHLDSPIMVDHAIQTFLGQPGQFAIKALETSLQKAGLKMPNAVPPYELADIPFVGALTSRQPQYNAQPIHDFNEKFEKLQAVNNSLKELQKAGKDEDAEDFEARHPELQKFDDMKEVHETLKQQNQLIRGIQMDPSQPDADKKRNIEAAFKESSIIAKTKLDELNGKQ